MEATPSPLLLFYLQVSYRSYWTREILEVLREHKASLSIKDISEKTAIRTGEPRLAALRSTTSNKAKALKA